MVAVPQSCRAWRRRIGSWANETDVGLYYACLLAQQAAPASMADQGLRPYVVRWFVVFELNRANTNVKRDV